MTQLDLLGSYELLEILGTPKALAVYLLLKAEEWGELEQIAVNPGDYQDAGAYLLDAQAVALIKKNFDLDRPELEDRAVRSFLASEHCCFDTNRRLWEGYQSPSQRTFFSKVRSKIRGWVGPLNVEKIDYLLGPGATMSDPARRTTVPEKFTSSVTLTRGMFPWLPTFARTAWARGLPSRELSEVRGNTFFTVSKSFGSRRTCAKEPSLNVSCQKGLASLLRRRLRPIWDLDLAQDRHRALALQGSEHGGWATLDLKDASDRQCDELIRLSWPQDWEQALRSARSSYCKVGERWHRLEKFSSMGCGYTFEVMTITIAALLSVACDLQLGVDLFVFGDDVIVPSHVADVSLSCLRYAGYTVNTTKSYVTGCFRESCGGDYFGGKDVRPYYPKEFPKDPQGWMSLHNGVKRTEEKLRACGVNRSFEAFFARCRAQIPSQFRVSGPKELGDMVLRSDNPDEWHFKWKNSIRYFRVYRPQKFRKVLFGWFTPDVQMASVLYGAAWQSEGRGGRQHDAFLVPRDGVRGFGLAWVPFS